MRCFAGVRKLTRAEVCALALGDSAFVGAIDERSIDPPRRAFDD